MMTDEHDTGGGALRRRPDRGPGQAGVTWCPIHRTMEELSITRPDARGSGPWGAVDGK